MEHNKLLIRLMVAIFAGMVAGVLVSVIGEKHTGTAIILYRSALTLTSLFSSFLSFIIPFLILVFVASGLVALRGEASRLAVITLALAFLSTILAGTITYLAGSCILPFFTKPIYSINEHAETLSAFFEIGIEPPLSVMSALVLAFVLGLGMVAIKGKTLLGVIEDFRKIISKMLEKLLLPLMPVYVACVFFTLSAHGEIIPAVKSFAGAIVLIIVLQILYIVFAYVAASVICRKNHIKNIAVAMPAYLAALGTQSSAATIPVTLECAYKNDISKDVADFCIPLCATVHLAGDTIAIVGGTVSAMLAGGQALSFGEFLPFILMLGVTMVAAPGVPGGGMMSAHGLIASMFSPGVGLEQMLIAMHFAQDSFGTAANVTGDLALALICEKIFMRCGKKTD